MSSLETRYLAVCERIERACRRAGRSPGEVTLVAVSKTFPAGLVAALHELGHVDFGENKAQELAAKASDLPDTIRWHAIGHLQRNKVRDVISFAHTFHALDSDRLAVELNRRSEAAGRILPCLVQVNVSGEATKSGLDPDAVHGFVDGLAAFASLRVVGLMTLASPAEDPEDVRSEFAVMRRLADSYRGAGGRLEALSMGMSHDFEVAIEEGATHVRVGSAIFGER